MLFTSVRSTLPLGAGGSILGWLASGLFFFAASTATGAELRVQGFKGDPFAGRATVTGWTLRAAAAPAAGVLARGGASEIAVANWQATLATDPEGVAVIDSLDLAVTEATLAPDAKGAWPLLAIAAASGLPYEKNGPTGEGPRVRIRRLRLRVDTVIVRDARTGRDTPVRIAWRGEFRDLDHTRPLVTALLAAVREASLAANAR